MSRTPLFHQISRVIGTANFCDAERISTSDGIERLASRRQFLKTAGAVGLAISPLGALASRMYAGPRIAIIGGGLAGLACADRLQAKGFSATIYEAATRLGGRCFSNRALIAGMACENGGEFIDTGHKMMLAYANEFGLAKETVTHQVGEERLFFFGQHWTVEQVVDEFRQVVANMQPDLHSLSGAASFYSSNQADIALDNTDLETYFGTRCAGFPLVQAVLNEAFLAEYGLETSQQSSLNFLGFMRLNKQSKFEPFGTSDERYHLLNGNDGIVAGLQAKLNGPIQRGARLTKIAQNVRGEYLLYFNGSNVPEKADVVVMTVPFTVLRGVQLDASLGLSNNKKRAIQTLGYGNNAKTMVAFNGRHWASEFQASGTSYSDRTNVQNTWESNPAKAGSRAILTDYASGHRGVSLRTSHVQQQVGAFLNDLEVVFPGVKATAVETGANYVAHLEHWPTNPNSLGSYTCYRPGQFTGIEGLSAEASGLMKFAGEHADSFYSWQGYMEGACLSGLRAANEVLADIKAGRV